jgi:hypothetical protein
MIVLAFAAVVALQVQVKVTTSRDSTVARSTSAGISVTVPGARDSVRRIAVTPEHLATAFQTPAARTLLERARVARFTMDSALRSYDAKAYQRISVGLGVRETGRTRLAARDEAVGRVQYLRGRGAFVDLLGKRTTSSFDEQPTRPRTDSAGRPQRESLPGREVAVPYFPGSDDLWIGGSIARVEVDERQIVHPLAVGSEAYYQYEVGDSLSVTLPDGRRLVTVELRVTAREPRWNLIVGSFWFDRSTARLTRAAYRLSVDLDVWELAADEGNLNATQLLSRGLITPVKGGIDLITIEYALFEGRFWLPTIRAAEGRAQASFIKLPVVFEERFDYEAVNGPTMVAQMLDSVPGLVNVRRLRDSLTGVGIERKIVDSLVTQRLRVPEDSARLVRAEVCRDPSAGALRPVGGYGARLPVVVRIPCDLASLKTSKELPASPYDSGEELFGTAGREELRQALDFGLQAGWGPQRVVFDAGLGLTRYNRVEGFSTGITARQELGQGFAWDGQVRGSLGDRTINGELRGRRTSGITTVSVGAYRRLVSSNDWGTPLTFGASFANALYARDEGLYHRAWGGDVQWRRERAGRTTFTLFAEEQWSAPVTTRWSLFRGNGDDRFIENLVADRGTFVGGAMRWQRAFGLDPRGWRVDTDLRLEGAGGSAEYGRGAMDVQVSHALPRDLIGSLTAAAGSSVGEVPAQRLWYLGGLQTIRGQTAGTAAGDAFWMVRTELARGTAFRTSLFGDLGWAGSREAISDIGRPMSGVGVGFGVLDGILRLDVARGLFPREQWRVDLSLGARF